MRLRLTRPEPTEAQVLASVLHFLERHPAVAWVTRMNTGQGLLARRKGGEARWVKFGFPGCPDIHGMLKGGRAFYVECKRPSKRTNLSDEQAQFIRIATFHGGLAFVACGIEDCAAALGGIE